MKKLISPGLSPNLELVDVLEAIKLLFKPALFKNGDVTSKVEEWFKYNYDSNFVFTFSSAREGLYAILKAIKIKSDDEVIVQAFTCSAAVYPILWAGAKPIFVDIDPKSLSVSISSLKKKITSKTRVIILQHTFGIPGPIDEIKKMAKDKKIFVIEDCAHVIGSLSTERKLGTYFDAAIFSFGRDKAVSSVFGGAVIVKKRSIAQSLSGIEALSPYPSTLWIYQQLAHPILTFLVLRGFFIHQDMGKILLVIFKKLHFISKPILENANLQFVGKGRIKRFSNALAILALSQLVRSSRFNRRRREIVLQYKERLKGIIKFVSYDPTVSYLRFPILTDRREKLFEFCKEDLVYLGDWYSNVIDPKDADLKELGYVKGTCRMAERIASQVVNLPCYPTMSDSDVGRVISLITDFFKKHGKKVSRRRNKK